MRVFYARAADNPNYAVAHALANLVVPPERLDVALFRGSRVPLAPQNFSPQSEGLTNPGLYDLVVLAGVDPAAIPPREQLALVAYVERGGALMLIGGQHAFANAEGSYLLLAPMLPVKVGRAEDVVVNSPLRAEGHPVSVGLPEPLGYVSRVHAIEPKPRAQVVMHAARRPVVVAGESGPGRVVVVAAYPECEESEYGWFFTGDAFDDFVRNTVAWLTRTEPAARIERFTFAKRQLHPGDEGFGKVAVGGRSPEELKIRTCVLRSDQAVVKEATAPVRQARSREMLFSFRLPDEPAARGIHYVVLDLVAAGRVLDRRDVAIEVSNPMRVEVDFEFGRRWVRPGERLRFRIEPRSELRRPPAEIELEISLLDTEGKAVAPPRRRTTSLTGKDYRPVEVELDVPRLRPGPYRLVVEARVGGQLADVATEEIAIVRRAVQNTFPLVVGGVCHLDAAAVEAAVAAVAAVGASAVFLRGRVPGRWGERPHAQTMNAHAETVALAEGLWAWWEVASLEWPCPSVADFDEGLARVAGPVLEALAAHGGRAVAWFEAPTGLRPWSPCACDACRAEGKSAESGAGERLGRLARRFASGLARLRDETAPGLPLAVALDARCLFPPAEGVPPLDALPWAEAFEVLEAAPERDLRRQRALVAYLRGCAGALGKRFGAALALEAGYPTPREAAWSALVHGASHLRVVGNEPFVGKRLEPPLGEALDGFLVALSRIGPFIAEGQPIRPPLALVVVPGEESRGQLGACDFLHAVCGGVDLLDWRLASAEALARHRAIAIMGVARLPRPLADAIVGFVEQGGLLLCDNVGLLDETGAPLEWPAGFFGTAETAVIEDVSVRRRRFGLGRTIVFSPNLLEAFERAAARGDQRLVGELVRAAGKALREHGSEPPASADAPGVEVGLRQMANSCLVLAVNHSDERAAGRVGVGLGGFRPRFAVDLLRGSVLEVEDGGFAVSVAPRDGGAWVLYESRPFGLRVEVAGDEACPGEELAYRLVVTDEAGRPASGQHLVSVEVTDPGGRLRPGLCEEFLTTDGLAERTLGLATNEAPGRWEMKVRELATRRAVKQTFELKGNDETR